MAAHQGSWPVGSVRPVYAVATAPNAPAGPAGLELIVDDGLDLMAAGQ